MDPADMEDVEDVEEEETGEDVNSKGQENKTLLLQTWTVFGDTSWSDVVPGDLEL